MTIFIVSQRLPDQSTGGQWQKILSSSDPTGTDDSRAPNISFLALPDGSPKPYPCRVEEQEFSDARPGTVFIGRSARSDANFFQGEVCEILIYDRTFMSEDESGAVLEYLQKKWGAQPASADNGWTRVGLLPNPPQRIKNDFPLSDQTNQEHWIKNEELSDEFNGTSLDKSKWQTFYPNFHGMLPTRYNAENVNESGGHLRLTLREAPSTNNPAIKYSGAIVSSTHLAGYGYYETRAQAGNSAGDSTFWFHRSETPNDMNEIDVYEIGGKSPGFDRKYNMNLHVWETPTEGKHHWSIGNHWIAPWRFADDFHVFGLEWDANEIKYYVDGVIVRRVKNTNWHVPLHMNFDTEVMATWFDLPEGADLPATYNIDYVRAWQRQ